MPTEEGLTHAIGCLSTVFPQFVAKELALLMDGILAGVQGFTDPLAAAADLNLDSLIGKVAELSQGDVFGNLASAGAGLASQHVKRELSETMNVLSEEFPGVTKRVQQMRNLGERVVTTGHLMMGLYADMPFVAAQNMCSVIVKMADLKNANLQCMRKHITQLANAIIVLAKNVNDYTDWTLSDLTSISDHLDEALVELQKSQPIRNGEVAFDPEAFDRARTALLVVSSLLTPDNDGTSILDVADILSYGSVEAAHVSRSNLTLAKIAIPSLIALIDAEMAAAKSQTEIINHMIGSLRQVMDSFRAAASTSRVQAQRARGIAEIRARITDLKLRVDVAATRGSTKAASMEMLLWASRVKAMIVVIDQIKDLSFQEGSVDDVGETAKIQKAFDKLLLDLSMISSADSDSSTINGIEDMTALRSKVFGLTKGAARILEDLEIGRANASRMATFHALVAQSTIDQVSIIEDSMTVASNQKAACLPFLELQIRARENFDQLVDCMRQLGLDRAVDLLGSGEFARFLDTTTDALSYLGTVIKCLTETIDGIDDDQTKRQIAEIRDSLVAKRTNQDVAAADSSDLGITRFIGSLQAQISDIQKNAKTVESILSDLTAIAKRLKIDIGEAGSGLDAFASNIDRLAVGAGGRLAAGLEEFSKHPKAGVPLCDAP